MSSDIINTSKQREFKAYANGFRRTVGIFIESSRAYCRGILRGISRFSQEANWRLLYHDIAVFPKLPGWLSERSLSGIISHAEDPETISALLGTSLPMVDLRGQIRRNHVPVVWPDAIGLIKSASDHLMSKGIDHVAYCGFGGLDFSVERLHAYLRFTEARGLRQLTHMSPDLTPRHSTAATESQAMESDTGLIDWLRALPKGVGIIACNNVRGRQILDMCRLGFLNVPDEVAVIGIDDDDIYCLMGTPHLTSIALAGEATGLMAARVLEQITLEPLTIETRHIIPPLQVIVRASTDRSCQCDDVVACVTRYISEELANIGNGDDVLEHLAQRGQFISRSTLDRKFRKQLGKSLREHLLWARMDRVRRLLRESRLPLSKIAYAVGILHPEQLSVQFKRETGETLGHYRKIHHLPANEFNDEND